MSYSATKGKKRKAIQKQYDLHHGLGKSVPRGSSKATITSNSNSMNINNNNNNKKKKKTGCYDLNVSLPKIKKTTISFTRLQEIIKRLADLGYTTIALTHSIFGRYDKESDVDFGHVSIPFSFQSHGEDNNNEEKRKNSGDNDVRKEVVVETYGMKVLKRLNIIIEEMSDLSYYTSNESNNKLGKKVENDSEGVSFLHRLYESYDLISFTPRTESTFSSLCQSKNIMFDILTLDYTIGNASMSSTSGRKFGGGGGGGLPYTLRGSDFTAIFSSSSSSEIPPVLELNYAPAISDPSKRRNWIVTATEYQNVVSTLSKTSMRKISSDNNNNSNNRKAISMFSSTASRGKKKNPHEKVRARMIVSSGIRKYKPQSTDGTGYQQDDLGALALRSSHDINNVSNVVLGLNEYKECTNEFCDYVLQKAYLRKSGVHSYTLGNNSENNQQQMLDSNHRNVEVLLGCHDLSGSNSSIPKAGDLFQLASRQNSKDNHQPLPSSQHSVGSDKDSERSNSPDDDNMKVDTHNNDTGNTDKNSKSDQEEEDEDDGIIMFT